MLGLTFKPNTDDMREAPSIPLITALQDMGAKVRAYDPAGMTHAGGEFPDVAFADGPYACAEGADALVIVTEWEQFRALDLDRLKAVMKQPVLVDLRNVYRPAEMARARLRLRQRRPGEERRSNRATSTARALPPPQAGEGACAVRVATSWRLRGDVPT